MSRSELQVVYKRWWAMCDVGIAIDEMRRELRSDVQFYGGTASQADVILEVLGRHFPDSPPRRCSDDLLDALERVLQ